MSESHVINQTSQGNVHTTLPSISAMNQGFNKRAQLIQWISCDSTQRAKSSTLIMSATSMGTENRRG